MDNVFYTLFHGGKKMFFRISSVCRNVETKGKVFWKFPKHFSFCFYVLANQRYSIKTSQIIRGTGYRSFDICTEIFVCYYWRSYLHIDRLPIARHVVIHRHRQNFRRKIARGSTQLCNHTNNNIKIIARIIIIIIAIIILAIIIIIIIILEQCF